MNAATVLDPRRMYRQIADLLARKVQSGEFPVGSRLPSERDLAEQLGVSRPSVREGLIALEVEGVVDVRLGSGVFVRALPKARAEGETANAPGPFDVIKARGLIEGECAALAAVQANETHLRRMQDALREMRRSDDHTAAGTAADHQFHLAIAEAAGNAALLMCVQQLWVQRTSPLYTQLESHFTGQRVWALALAEHAELLDAIASRDPEAARQAMRKHMKNAEIRFAESWRLPADPA